MARYGALIASGVSILILTALVGLWGFGHPRAGSAYQIAAVVLVVLLVVGAWLLARFVRGHGEEIGEARFDTRNSDEREG